jgi:pimeloyl-ACP methyl ester carboxylesterase
MPATAPPATAQASNVTAPTQFIETKLETYAYRRFGGGSAPPMVCLQHFTGTLDNWDPAVTDALALGREVILFEFAGHGSLFQYADAFVTQARRFLD